MVGGQRVAVAIEPEWLRYLAGSLFDRGGGTTGSGTGDLETAQFDDAGIEDLKIAVARLSDEMPNALVYAEIDALRARLDHAEQAPSTSLTIENITNTTTSGADIFAATFLGAL